MSVSRDPLKGKNYEGSHFGGEGKSNIDGTKSEPEFAGVYRSAPNPKLSPAVGYTSKRDGSEESGFSLDAKGYSGPQNWTPKNLGVRSPDELEHS